MQMQALHLERHQNEKQHKPQYFISSIKMLPTDIVIICLLRYLYVIFSNFLHEDIFFMKSFPLILKNFYLEIFNNKSRYDKSL